jgi:hypothetical protein
MQEWVNIDGVRKLVELTPEEINAIEAEAKRAETEYWTNTPYGEAVNAEIRKKYSDSDEFAILRQATEKPEEYAEYYKYCEECKAYVKAQKERYVWQY